MKKRVKASPGKFVGYGMDKALHEHGTPCILCHQNRPRTTNHHGFRPTERENYRNPKPNASRIPGPRNSKPRGVFDCGSRVTRRRAGIVRLQSLVCVTSPDHFPKLPKRNDVLGTAPRLKAKVNLPEHERRRKEIAAARGAAAGPPRVCPVSATTVTRCGGQQAVTTLDGTTSRDSPCYCLHPGHSATGKCSASEHVSNFGGLSARTTCTALDRRPAPYLRQRRVPRRHKEQQRSPGRGEARCSDVKGRSATDCPKVSSS